MRCAVKVQRRVPVLDGDQPPDRAIRFRVGINIGDAIADGTDLHGDAVNVAARLQAECRAVSASLVLFGIMCTDDSTWLSRRLACFI